MARPRLTGSAIIATVILLLLLCVGEVLTGEPVVYLADTEFEFAPVVEGVTVEHDFILANRGDAPLAILAVKSG
ncbi:MAG: hypothetical protein IH612_21320 [Desulfofustis sp.]|nr:hypothetical protein [Desulfofustis sp.]